MGISFERDYFGMSHCWISLQIQGELTPVTVTYDTLITMLIEYFLQWKEGLSFVVPRSDDAALLKIMVTKIAASSSKNSICLLCFGMQPQWEESLNLGICTTSAFFLPPSPFEVVFHSCLRWSPFVGWWRSLCSTQPDSPHLGSPECWGMNLWRPRPFSSGGKSRLK